jgi:predicted nucleic acid-binding protein
MEIIEKICLDTNTYSAFKRNNTEVIHLIETAESIYIPSIVIGELFAGFYIGNKTETNISELEDFLSLPGIEVTPIEKKVSKRYGYLIKELRAKGTPLPSNDIWISAACFETASVMVTNDKHFDLVPGLMVRSYER